MADLKDDLAALRIEREPIRTRRRNGPLWITIVILVLGGGAAWAWFARERPLEVQTAAVEARAAGAQTGVLNATGYVTARRRATVSSKITGKVIEVNIEEGMVVHQGQVLARLDDSTPRATLALARAQAQATRQGVHENEVRREQASITLARMQRLRKDGHVSEAEVDLARTELDSTDARILALREQVNVADRQVELEETNLDNTVIRAPFNGVAISKDAQPGEMVSPVSAGGGFTRTGIGTIVDMKSLEIEVDVNEAYINRVTPGQPVTAVLDAYPEWQIPAHVITTIPAADRQKATVLVRIAFEKLDPRLLPDMGVKVTFLRDAPEASTAALQPATLAPKAAIRTTDTGAFAYVTRGDTVERRAVQVAGSDGDRVEIRAGLKPGEQVVLSPPAELQDGMRVRIKP
ncbi:MAG: efflux RND transporter periplasmic adaptor subunit [Vicinamibacterales bacterium]|nr:efflux RND transporter periplasmic adaptor subunit [Vicinamibacterales bacterium]